MQHPISHLWVVWWNMFLGPQIHDNTIWQTDAKKPNLWVNLGWFKIWNQVWWESPRRSKCRQLSCSEKICRAKAWLVKHGEGIWQAWLGGSLGQGVLPRRLKPWVEPNHITAWFSWGTVWGWSFPGLVEAWGYPGPPKAKPWILKFLEWGEGVTGDETCGIEPWAWWCGGEPGGGKSE